MYQNVTAMLKKPQVRLCLFLGLMLSSTVAAADKQLNWVINTAPPFHIVSGPLAGQGICDVLINLIDEQLPEFQSNRTVLPQTRIRQQFEREQDQCFPCMIHRAVPADTIQSNPSHFYYPHGIITSAENAEKITARYGSPVALQQLIADRDFRLGYPAGRHYPELQHIIDQGGDSAITRVVHTGENATVAILAMIKAKRLDYTIDYQILHNFDITENGTTELAFLPIAETANTYVLGAVGCTNTAWGRMVITEINRVLPTVHRHPDFLAVLDLWFRNPPSNEPYLELLRNRVWQYSTPEH